MAATKIPSQPEATSLPTDGKPSPVNLVAKFKRRISERGAAAGAGTVPSSLAIDVKLPAGHYLVKDLPQSVMPWVFAAAPTSAIAPIKQAKVGVALPLPTTVNIALTADKLRRGPLAGVQAGLLVRAIRAIAAFIVAVWVGLLVFLHLRPKAPKQNEGGTGAKADWAWKLSLTPSHTLKGTLNGLPAWVAYQEIKGVCYDVAGNGKLRGKVRLFNLLPLPGLTSSLYPSAMRLVLPNMRITLPDLAARGLACMPQTGGLKAGQDARGTLVISRPGQETLVPGFAGTAVRVSVQEMFLAADRKSLSTKGALLTEWGSQEASTNQIRAEWSADVKGDLQHGVPSNGAPVLMTGEVRLQQAFSASQEFVPLDSLKVALQANSQDIAASIFVGDQNTAQDASIKEVPNNEQRLRALNEVLGLPQAAVLISASDMQAHWTTDVKQGMAALNATDDDVAWERDSDADSDLDVWFDAHDDQVQDVVEPTTPKSTLVGSVKGLSSSPSTLTLPGAGASEETLVGGADEIFWGSDRAKD